MKFFINRLLRTGLIVIVILIEVLILILLYNKINNPGLHEQTIPKYNYTNMATADYQVYHIPNDLYQNSTQKSGEIYILKLIDRLVARFEYKFEGSSIVSLNGSYDIVAKVSGSVRSSSENTNAVIWEKNFTLKEKQNFSVNDSSLTINEKLPIKLDDFNEFSRLANETSGISFITSLQVLMNININGTTDNGTIEEVIIPSIVIPLDTAMFEITTNNIESNGAIEETIQVQLPVNTKQVLLYGIIIGILTLGLIFLIFFVKAAPNKDPYEKMLNKIFKKHGDRLVALNNDLKITAKYCSVKSIDDLVRIADEVSKPIMYKYSENYKEINKFYVTHEDEVYIFKLEELIPIEKVEDIEETTLTSTSEEI